MDAARQRPGSDLVPTPIGARLREWRTARHLSQLQLALAAETSARHLSCIETGKSRPGRELLARLADALEMPLRERNALLLDAGFAPQFPESALGAPVLARIDQAIDAILAQQSPYPAFLINRRWDVLRANDAAARVNRLMLGGRDSAHANIMRQFFDPADLRAAVANWEEVAGELIRHLHEQVAAVPGDRVARELLEEMLAYPGVPARWRTRDLSSPPSPLLTTTLRRDGVELRFFSTITTFAMPRDITLDELHIECCFPMDDATAAHCRALVDGSAGARFSR
ncbi:transcriptional regulator with XRE-family HTH domain [Luteimonas sp. J16]|jgi:transcriptional regulator with XRE-family HTH domain|uniref:helix-turn-helix domain-containing protein n=1 Tax=unclassified Luteimonas TaxID=2629088 RepID=UPI0004B92B32|nr:MULTISPECIES: helix-turn-helix transcriptional regulator [unclassified Luteimonas]TWG94562.1 transcriptional regulator with XRE-family HTH domain [Luteimonas sp. J16]